MRLFISTFISISFSLFLYAGDMMSFNEAGFSIKSLESKPSQVSTYAVLAMKLPAVGRFSPNVNVMIQPYKKSIEDYKKLSESQFGPEKYKTVSSFIKDGIFYMEVAGKSAGALHFYFKAIKKGDLVYLATATDMESNWLNSSKKLTEAIDSFRLY